MNEQLKQVKTFPKASMNFKTNTYKSLKTVLVECLRQMSILKKYTEYTK